MAVRLVDDDRDVSLDLPLDPASREALGIQIQRCASNSTRNTFGSRLVEKLVEIVDADLKPPTERQVAFAIHLAKELGISIPAEALRFRGSMTEFLTRFGEAYRDRSPFKQPERESDIDAE